MNSKPASLASAINPDQLEIFLSNFVSQTGILDPNEALRQFNSGRWVVRSLANDWVDVGDGPFRFTVLSDGTSLDQWMRELDFNNDSDFILSSSDFRATNGSITGMVIMPHWLFNPEDLTPIKVREKANRMGFVNPTLEQTCLIRRIFPRDRAIDVGLERFVAMHDPIKDEHGGPSLLSVEFSSNDLYLSVANGRSESKFSGNSGFIFALPSYTV